MASDSKHLTAFLRGFLSDVVLCGHSSFVDTVRSSDASEQIYYNFIGLILKRLPTGVTTFVQTGENDYTGQPYYRPTLQFLLVVEMLLNLPVLTVAVIGGLVALAVRQHPRPNSSLNLV